MRLMLSHGNSDSFKRWSRTLIPKSNSWLPREAASSFRALRRSIICLPSKRSLSTEGEIASPANTAKVRFGFRARSWLRKCAARAMPPRRTLPSSWPLTSYTSLKWIMVISLEAAILPNSPWELPGSASLVQRPFGQLLLQPLLELMYPKRSSSPPSQYGSRMPSPSQSRYIILSSRPGFVWQKSFGTSHEPTISRLHEREITGWGREDAGSGAARKCQATDPHSAARQTAKMAPAARRRLLLLPFSVRWRSTCCSSSSTILRASMIARRGAN
mmetsp:Transcript_64659/g.166398  ORF Transcript_64659/g.166398 Transcript_64659/m.166398 type:complete len:273 (-) Transcript_64659:55-873(-)